MLNNRLLPLVVVSIAMLLHSSNAIAADENTEETESVSEVVETVENAPASVDSGTSEEDDALAKAQAAMNQEVLAQPFLAERPEDVESYIKDAMSKDLKPAEYKGTHWKSGYTCRDLLRYSWNEYRNCKYYHRYHGRYYW